MTRIDLFGLLPGFIRGGDAHAGHPLKALMGTLGSELDALTANIALLQDAWFIETCPDWIVPYIADLIGMDPTLTAAENPHLRGFVANSAQYQRARGTLATLGHAATAITGWPALAVDLDRQMLRSHAFASAPARSAGTMRIGATSATVSPIAEAPAVPRLTRGETPARRTGRVPRPGPSAIGLLIWRVQSHFIRYVEPKSLGQGRYALHALGTDSPLFTSPDRLPTNGRATAFADMPRPLTRIDLASMLMEGASLPLAIRVQQNGTWTELAPGSIAAADLRAWNAAWPDDDSGDDGDRNAAVRALVDPMLGRLRLSALVDGVSVDFARGTTRPMGGGVYGRADTIAMPERSTWVARVADDFDVAGPSAQSDSRPWFATLRDALEAVPAGETEVLIEISDNRIHRIRPPDLGGKRGTTGLLDWSDPETPVLDCAGRHVVIQAMDGFCPCVEGRLAMRGAGQRGRVALLGLWWHGHLTLQAELDLQLFHCTIWAEDGPAVSAGAVGEASHAIEVADCILGPLHLTAVNTSLSLTGSIVDGRGRAAVSGGDGVSPGPPLALQCCTVIGDLHIAGEAALTDSLVAGRIAGRPTGLSPALFRSLRYGYPDYAVLADDCPPDMARGAVDGGELGVFNPCRNRTRMACLQQVIDEYLPEGLSGELHFMT